MKSRSHLLTLISLLVGALLFAFVIRQTGVAALWRQVQTLNAWFGLILLLAGLRSVLRAYAWLHCLRLDERGISVWPLWRARLIGDAIGALTTAGPLLAEPARLVALQRSLPLTDAAAALSLEFLSYLLSACVMMLAGLVALLLSFAVQTPLRLASWLSVALLLLVLSMLGLALWRRWSLVALVHRVSSPVIRWHHFTQTFAAQLEPAFRAEDMHAIQLRGREEGAQVTGGAVREFEQHRGRVVHVDAGGQLAVVAERIHAADGARDLDHCIQRVDAARRHPPARRFGPGGPPAVGSKAVTGWP